MFELGSVGMTIWISLWIVTEPMLKFGEARSTAVVSIFSLIKHLKYLEIRIICLTGTYITRGGGWGGIIK